MWCCGYRSAGAGPRSSHHYQAVVAVPVPSELISLPWVGHDSPRWEPEPLRWVAVNAVTALFATADVTERRTGRPSRAAKTFWRAIGH
jgi:hypothetical protein